MPKKISIKQFLARSGRFDKIYDCVSAIREGRVKVNGNVVASPSYFFDPKKALVQLDDEKLKQAGKLYFILNKPAGYVCQKSPNEKSVYGLMEKLNLPRHKLQSLFVVGRLDRDTEGLLIITNDGALSHELMHPSRKIVKKYHVMLEKPINKEEIERLEKVKKLDYGDRILSIEKPEIKPVGRRELYISISEGKKRQIRKMLQAINHKVIWLKRISIGGLKLEKLKKGEFRQFERKEFFEGLGLGNNF